MLFGVSIIAMATISISRSLDAGWDYGADWRLQQVDAYLGEIANTPDRKHALQQILYREKDPVIRQALRYRMVGGCAANTAFNWALQCARDNARTGLLSMLKAMVIAGMPPMQIAKELGTAPFNVMIAEKLFFDVRRYLQNRIWLNSSVITQGEKCILSPEAARERRWLSVASESGSERLLKVLRGGEDASDETLEMTAQKIESITGRRALEYVNSLERDGTALNEDDLKRYLMARTMRSREAATTASEQQNKIKEWGLSLVRMFDAPKGTVHDAKTIANAMNIVPVQEMAKLAVRQIEARALTA